MDTQVDVDDLRDKVKGMYRAVAEAPDATFHFEMGRALAERLGYPPAELDRVPADAIESFAGVGYHLGRAASRLNCRSALADQGTMRSARRSGRLLVKEVRP